MSTHLTYDEWLLSRLDLPEGAKIDLTKTAGYRDGVEAWEAGRASRDIEMRIKENRIDSLTWDLWHTQEKLRQLQQAMRPPTGDDLHIRCEVATARETNRCAVIVSSEMLRGYVDPRSALEAAVDQLVRETMQGPLGIAIPRRAR